MHACGHASPRRAAVARQVVQAAARAARAAPEYQPRPVSTTNRTSKQACAGSSAAFATRRSALPQLGTPGALLNETTSTRSPAPRRAPLYRIGYPPAHGAWHAHARIGVGDKDGRARVPTLPRLAVS